MKRPSERAESLLAALRTDAVETDREGGFPDHSIDLLRDAGLLAAPVPGERGGESLGDCAHTRELLETLAVVGRGNLAVARLYEGHVNALQLIARYGDQAQQARWSGDAIAGCLFGVWNTEGADGVKLAPDGTAFCLSGCKTFASGLGRVRRGLFTATRDDVGGRGWQMVVVDADQQPPRADRSFWKPLGMRATASFRADFDGVKVPAEALLGGPGDYYREPAFSGGAIRFAAAQQGGAESVFDETRRFLRGLGRTDDPFQRARLGEMAWRIEAGRLWLDGAASHAGAAMSESAAAPGLGPDAAGTVAYAHLMRSAIEDGCLRVMALAERCVGARGLLRPEPFERLHRDLTHYLRQPAPDAALAEAGRYALVDPRAAGQLWC